MYTHCFPAKIDLGPHPIFGRDMKYRISCGPLRSKSMFTAVAALFALALSMGARESVAETTYPTVTRVEYVLACLASYGENRDNMFRCACAIDYIASEISLTEYDQVETILRMRGVPGERTGMFRDVPWINQTLNKFDAVERKASAACFGR